MGMALTPEETNLFPTEHVFPSIGTGSYGRAKKVVSFQLDLNKCPHLEGSLCKIYEKRPITCRMFPFEMEVGQPPKVLIDKKCKWYRDKVVSTGMHKKLMNQEEKIIAPNELGYCWVRLKAYEKIKKKDVWLFDLRRKAWFR
jgi:Fe-S-cluster containining protein